MVLKIITAETESASPRGPCSMSRARSPFSWPGARQPRAFPTKAYYRNIYRWLYGTADPSEDRAKKALARIVTFAFQPV